MVSRNNKKSQLPVKLASRVSRALWPAQARRTVATGKAAQRRRSLIIRDKWRLVSKESLEKSRYYQRPSLIKAITLLLIGSMLLAALVFHLWYLFLLSAALLAVLVARQRPIIAQLPGHAPHTPSSLKPSSLVRKPIGETIAVAKSAFLRAPETPVPASGEPPLVRVLETFDLSQTNVEHFLDPGIGGDTAELPLNWSEDQAVTYSTQSMPVSIPADRD